MIEPLPYSEARDVVVRSFELQYLNDLLRFTGGNVSAAARKARMDRSYLIKLMKKHGVTTKPAVPADPQKIADSARRLHEFLVGKFPEDPGSVFVGVSASSRIIYVYLDSIFRSDMRKEVPREWDAFQVLVTPYKGDVAPAASP